LVQPRSIQTVQLVSSTEAYHGIAFSLESALP
jgi:hypothetical protein